MLSTTLTKKVGPSVEPLASEQLNKHNNMHVYPTETNEKDFNWNYNEGNKLIGDSQ